MSDGEIMTENDVTIPEFVDGALGEIKRCLETREYVTVAKIWNDVWVEMRFAPKEEISVVRKRFGAEMFQLIQTTRLHIKQKRVRADILPRLQSITTRLCEHS